MARCGSVLDLLLSAVARVAPRSASPLPWLLDLLRSARVVCSALLAWSARKSKGTAATRKHGRQNEVEAANPQTLQGPQRKRNLIVHPRHSAIIEGMPMMMGSLSMQRQKRYGMSLKIKRKQTTNVKLKLKRLMMSYFFDAVGGWNEKGRVFGLGAADSSCYDRPAVNESKGKKSRRDYVQSLETKVVEFANRNDEQQRELDTTKERLDQTQKALEETQSSFMDLKKKKWTC